MSEERRTKQTAFRLPQRTLDILDEIVGEGKARTRTDALILAVDTAKNSNFIDDTSSMDKMKEYENRISHLEELNKARSAIVDVFIDAFIEQPLIMREIFKKIKKEHGKPLSSDNVSQKTD